MNKARIVILGGGLWGGLLAYRLKQTRPDLELLLCERSETLGGNHTWSFHESDLERYQFDWLKPLISRSWSGYDVRFPEFERRLSGNYHTIFSEDFHQRLMTFFSEGVVQLKQDVSWQEAHHYGDIVIDARGTDPGFFKKAGYQKFVGLEVVLKADHELQRPCLMDATVEQIDGYRFLYYLPLTSNTLLVEDTLYSNSSDLDVCQFQDRILAEIYRRGWEIKEIKRREAGILPIPYETFPRIQGLSLQGIFHWVTGYSLPHAVRMIDAICELPSLNVDSISKSITKLRDREEESIKYFQLLNRLLFEAATPKKRFIVFQHFYRMPESLIQRFYRGELSTEDKIKILCGRPPVPLTKAMKIIWQETTGGLR
jgi:lycopene beta-cyclase